MRERRGWNQASADVAATRLRQRPGLEPDLRDARRPTPRSNPGMAQPRRILPIVLPHPPPPAFDSYPPPHSYPHLYPSPYPSAYPPTYADAYPGKDVGWAEQDETYGQAPPNAGPPYRFPPGNVTTSETVNFNTQSNVGFWKKFNLPIFVVGLLPAILLCYTGFFSGLRQAVMGAGVGLLFTFCCVVAATRMWGVPPA